MHDLAGGSPGGQDGKGGDNGGHHYGRPIADGEEAAGGSPVRGRHEADAGGLGENARREYVHRRTLRTLTEARIRIATWITDFYNIRRLHSVCGSKNPIDYEDEHRAGLTAGLAV
ncbi:hypothetical protein ACODT5_22335 [Streptomyces sp. 5.8]|uniref:hypothetical protein n=1 Tax=Streptomyces sp. 5.8 TaxID=3406571 RepID=UPI003BB77D55